LHKLRVLREPGGELGLCPSNLVTDVRTGSARLGIHVRQERNRTGNHLIPHTASWGPDENSEPVQPGIQGNVEHVRSQFGQPSGQTSGHVKLCCGICHKPLRVATPPWIRVDSDLYLTGILPSSSHGYPSAVVTLSC